MNGFINRALCLLLCSWHYIGHSQTNFAVLTREHVDALTVRYEPAATAHPFKLVAWRPDSKLAHNSNEVILVAREQA